MSKDYHDPKIEIINDDLMEEVAKLMVPMPKELLEDLNDGLVVNDKGKLLINEKHIGKQGALIVPRMLSLIKRMPENDALRIKGAVELKIPRAKKM